MFHHLQANLELYRASKISRSLPHKKQELKEQNFRRGDFSGTVVVLGDCFFCLGTVCSPRKVSKASTS